MEHGTSLDGRLRPLQSLGLPGTGNGTVSMGAHLATGEKQEYQVFLPNNREEEYGEWWQLLVHAGKSDHQLLHSWFAPRVHLHFASEHTPASAGGRDVLFMAEKYPDRQSIAEISEVVRSFASYQPGWQGEGSVAPPQAEVDNAVKFLQKIPFRIVQPKAMIDGGGDVGFTWRHGDDYLEVGFADGEVSFCCQKGGEWHHGDFAFANDIPAKLLQSVWKVAGDG